MALDKATRYILPTRYDGADKSSSLPSLRFLRRTIALNSMCVICHVIKASTCCEQQARERKASHLHHTQKLIMSEKDIVYWNSSENIELLLAMLSPLPERGLFTARSDHGGTDGSQEDVSGRSTWLDRQETTTTTELATMQKQDVPLHTRRIVTPSASRLPARGGARLRVLSRLV